MKIDLKELENQKKRDLKGDLEFIEFLVDYIKKTPNKVWSKHQADFINPILKGANTDKDLYLKVKEIAKKS